MRGETAQTWVKFLDDLEGTTNTFNFNPNHLTLGDTYGPGNIAWRLAEPDFQYNVSEAMIFGITFTAIQAIAT